MPDQQQRERESAREQGETGRSKVEERERYGSVRRTPAGRESMAVGQRRQWQPSVMDIPGYRGAFLSSPWELMRRMSEDMDRLFESFQSGQLQTEEGRGAWSPQLEVERQGNELCIRADLPGLKPEDIEVNLDDGLLTIAGERRQEQRDEREGVRRTERSYGRFYRALQVPDGVQEDEISATFKDGVLELKIPVQERQQRRIQIKS